VGGDRGGRGGQHHSRDGGRDGGRGGNRRNQAPEEEPHPDEQVIFAKENLAKEGTFKYVPSRLSDTTAPEVILSKAKMILNKLSVTNFDKLSDEFMAVGIDSEELMGRAVEMIVVCAQVQRTDGYALSRAHAFSSYSRALVSSCPL